MLLQIKERNFIDKFKPNLNKTWTIHTHTNGDIYIYIYIYIYIHTHAQKHKQLKNIQTTNTSKWKSHFIPIN